MSQTTKFNTGISNKILASLPSIEYKRFAHKLEQVNLIFNETLYKVGEIIRYVYFPNSGIVSLLAMAEENATVEVGVVGNDGIIGLPIFLGVEVSQNEAIVQGAGLAMRMESADFQAECKKNGLLPQLLNRFTHSLLTQVSQSAACYRFHLIEARFARWLLMTSDRLQTNDFKITQEFLSNMLGVRREAVNKAATTLQKQELIKYSRGNISIINPKGLENISCKCYFTIRNEELSFPVLTN